MRDFERPVQLENDSVGNYKYQKILKKNTRFLKVISLNLIIYVIFNDSVNLYEAIFC